MDSLKKLQLQKDLSNLDRNFFERDAQTGELFRTFTPPSLDEVLANDYPNDSTTQKISEMLSGDSVKKLYAGILLSAVDKDRGREILETLTDDSTQITIQISVGFGLVECSVGVLARDFLTRETIRGNNYAHVEALSMWALAISTEKKSENQSFEQNYLPKWEDVLAAQENTAEARKLRQQIERLKNGSVAERFYAAALLETIDQAESRQVLESLLTETAKVSLLSGDVMNNVPAHQAAESLLNPPSLTQVSEIRDPIARAFKWLSKAFDGEKRRE